MRQKRWQDLTASGPTDWFTVAALADDATPEQVPEFYVEITPHGNYAKVFFVDPFGQFTRSLASARRGSDCFLSTCGSLTPSASPSQDTSTNFQPITVYYEALPSGG